MEIILKEIGELREELKAHEEKLKVAFPKYNEILSYEQTMKVLNCSRNFLDSLRKEGLVKVYKLKGRLYCRYSELLEAIDQQLINVQDESVNPISKKKPASRA